MRSNYFFIFAMCFAVSLLPNAVLAQEDSNTIAYGDTVVGEITNREFEIEYTFTGKADDVVVIEMHQVDVLGDLDHPVIMVLDTEYNPL